MNSSNGLVAVAVARDIATVSSLASSSSPFARNSRLSKSASRSVDRFRRRIGTRRERLGSGFYELNRTQIEGSSLSVLVGPGDHGPESMEALVRYWSGKFPHRELKMMGTLDADLKTMNSEQIMTLARRWYSNHRDFILD